MVNPIKVGVAALLIFVTFSQSAPADPSDHRMAKALIARRLRIIEGGATSVTRCKGLVLAIAEDRDPIPCILQEIENIVGIEFPESSGYTSHEVLTPSVFQAMGQSQLRIARAYHAYILEMLKRLFLYIQSHVPGQPANLMGCNRLLAGLALVRDVLVVYYMLENALCRYYRRATRCDELVLPNYHDGQQPVAEHCRDMAKPFDYSKNLRYIMRSSLKKEIAQLRGGCGPSRTERDAQPVRPAHECLIADGARQERNLPRDASEACGVLRRPSEVDTLITHHHQLLYEYQASVAEGAQAARQNYNMFNQPNAHGNNEASPSVINLTNDEDESTQNYENSIGRLYCFGSDRHHEDDRNRPAPELIDFFGRSEKPPLDVSLGMHDPERWKGTTPPVEEPSPLALSSSHWHHSEASSSSHWHRSESSSHSHGKGKRPMNLGSAEDIYSTQQPQGGRRAHGKSRLGDASKG
ncbi:hypothetical protein SeLEV6574_g00570 [Synchytrium endobioticum]|uniref:ENTH domain-containing protein n=1 Tax=Synchytrium endobioticum TaxID=286115 RepID=A0A507DH90_9FUNG|nr:hypothetical protein SeLEV6574_g00570 [Synchytrium endobioticum]